MRRLFTGYAFGAGDHDVKWDGKVDGKLVPAGEYTWRAVSYKNLALRERGWIGDFGGDRGSPSAAAADDSRVYLGWSLTSANGDAVAALDSDCHILWQHRRGALCGCRALAVDAGLVFVLGGEGADAEGRAIYRLDAKTGSPAPWPDGRIDLKINSLWPANGTYKPDIGDYLAANNGRLYVSFSDGQFIAVLDAKTGKYLQTIVGAPPGPVADTATKSDDPSHPGQLIDADFFVTALKGGAIGTLLLAHDPIWVLASDFTPIEGGERVTALSVIGDAAPHHKDDIFVGLGPLLSQVQARPALATDTVTYTAGEAGGHAAHGPWQANRLGDIRAMALDRTGQLWVAEGDSAPRRISVWTTDAAVGRLVHEFFAPPDPGSPVVIDPLDPSLVCAGGCEWRLAPNEPATCLGVITREPVQGARFAAANGKRLLALTTGTGEEQDFERLGDGNYRKVTGPVPAATPARFQLPRMPDGSYRLTTADGFDLGTFFYPVFDKVPPHFQEPYPDPRSPFNVPPAEASLSESQDGRVFIAARLLQRVLFFELKGLETLRPLESGKIAVP